MRLLEECLLCKNPVEEHGGEDSPPLGRLSVRKFPLLLISNPYSSFSGVKQGPSIWEVLSLSACDHQGGFPSLAALESYFYGPSLMIPHLLNGCSHSKVA